MLTWSYVCMLHNLKTVLYTLNKMRQKAVYVSLFIKFMNHCLSDKAFLLEG